jgi:hypothetical protein
MDCLRTVKICLYATENKRYANSTHVELVKVMCVRSVQSGWNRHSSCYAYTVCSRCRCFFPPDKFKCCFTLFLKKTLVFMLKKTLRGQDVTRSQVDRTDRIINIFSLTNLYFDGVTEICVRLSRAVKTDG